MSGCNISVVEDEPKCNALRLNAFYIYNAHKFAMITSLLDMASKESYHQGHHKSGLDVLPFTSRHLRNVA